MTADIALRLAKQFGTTPEFWLNLQRRVTRRVWPATPLGYATLLSACYGDFAEGHSGFGGGPRMAQILRHPTSYDTAMALVLVATPMVIIVVALGMIIFGGLVLP